MTKATVDTNPAITSDATFRSWGSPLSAALATSGLVQTSDTGQINWTTVTRPSAGSLAGYEIWKFNDSLQSTAPIFIRIDYGVGTSQAHAYLRTITVGTGSNGSGTITGPQYAFTSWAYYGGQAAVNANSTSYFSHSSQGFFVGVWNWQGYGTNQFCNSAFLIDRTRDSSGTATGAGCLILLISTNSLSGTVEVCINFSTNQVYGPIAPIAPFPDLSSTAGANIYMSKHYSFTPSLAPSIVALTYNYNDLANLTTFTATTWGSHTYMAMGRYTFPYAGNNGGYSGSNASAANEQLAALAMIWED